MIECLTTGCQGWLVHPCGFGTAGQASSGTRTKYGNLKNALLSRVAVVFIVLSTSVALAQDSEPTVPLIEQAPFDRIILTAANDNAVVDVQLLSFPERQVPDPFPLSGMLELRRLSDPSVAYAVAWTDIAKIVLYEQLLLQEVEKLLAANQIDEAYKHLDFLHRHYPELPGLKKATETYLQRDAMTAFQEKRYDESLAILSALFDINPQRRGLGKAIEGVSDRLITEQLANRDFAGARQMLDSLREEYEGLALTNIAAWQEKFQTGAEQQLDVARQAITAGEYADARQAIQKALAILPDIEEARTLFDEIERLSPQIVVGVSQQALSDDSQALRTWSEERVGRLTNPRFVELVRVGTEGGEYECRWGEIEIDDAGLLITITFNAAAREVGISPEAVALKCLRMADPKAADYDAGFADVFSHVEVVDGQQAVVHLRYAHVKPIALLQFPVAHLTDLVQETVPFQSALVPNSPQTIKFTSPSQTNEQMSQVILEEASSNDEQALAMLRRGDLDILERIPPWQVDQTTQMDDVTVAAYRLPTLHVLLCNFENPLLQRREFRRALCYGIDRARMITEVLVGKESRPGFRVLSGPLPAGITIGDTLGYGYKQELQPLPYEPRLAVVLSASARTAVAKLPDAPTKEKAEEEDLAEAKTEPLVLLHPADAVARVTCELIKRQLDAIGIPIELKEQTLEDDSEWDLHYAELCLWEPIVDARRLLGPGGLAGRCSPTMNLALRELGRSTNWNDARTRLQRIHQLAFDDLPVIPLWQTVNHFAHRRALAGLSQTPVSLYQDVSQWQVGYQTAEEPQ
ncbi:MAG: ABC transporter substrate-binding protein [Bythopirellula sp.]|nr:ABC transporter substrate-binding protein [Bythopirellula sp.]